MAGSEGSVGGQTDLLSWSSVVHRPSEDPEPSSLPSTVDITAFSSTPSVEPTQGPNDESASNSDSDSGSDSENSGTDASGSCSYSSSDSDSSTSSQGSSASSTQPQQYSVTSSQSNRLRITIANVRKSCSSPPLTSNTNTTEEKSLPKTKEKIAEKNENLTNNKQNNKSTNDNNNDNNSVIKNLQSPKLSDSSDSESNCNSDNNSTSSDNHDNLPVNKSGNNKSVVKESSNRTSPVAARGRLTRKTVQQNNKEKVENTAKKNLRSRENANKVSPRGTTRGRGRPATRGNKVASLPVSRVSPPHVSSSDSESSDSETNSAMLASCSLPEIPQDDLAAILPDQQDCDAFGVFEYETRPDKATENNEDASGSDMELPTQLVNAAIQRVTESSSETESPPPAYASTLLQQFVQQQQMLNHGQTSTVINENEGKDANTPTNGENQNSKDETVKRKRGRPRKATNNNKDEKENSHSNIINPEYCAEPNVSPDSGIQNSPDRPSSPEPNLPIHIKSKTDTQAPKEVHQKSHSKSTKHVKNTQQLPKPKVTAYNLDRVLYCGTDRVLYPPRRKPGRPTLKVGIRKPGRPPKQPNQVCDSENLAPKNKNVQKSQPHEHKKVQKTILIHKQEKPNKKQSKNTCDNSETVKKEPPKNKGGAILNEICERVSKRLEQTKTQPSAAPVNKPLEENNRHNKTNQCNKHGKNKARLNVLKSKFATLKHLKVMHTKHKHKKHKKHKIKILRTLSVPHPIPKADTDIDKLIADFIRLCNLGTNKFQKENVPEVFRNCVKRVSKKRKTIEENRKKKKQQINSNESKEHNSNEQRLPLKKRHYHISNTNEPQKHECVEINQTTIKTEEKTQNNKNSIPKTKVEKETAEKDENTNKTVPSETKETKYSTDTEDIIGNHIDEAIEACINKYTFPIKVETNLSVGEVNKTEIKTPSFGNSVTATTPKKRHRLEEAKTDAIEKVSKKLDQQEIEKIPQETTKNSLENVVSELKNKKSTSNQSSPENNKKDNLEAIAQMITRKKNRLEDLTSNLVSKMSPAPQDEKEIPKVEKKPEKNLHRASVIKSPIAKKIKPGSNDILDSVVNDKPTGIFMPSIDLELHIPANTIQTKENEKSSNLRKKKEEEVIVRKIKKEVSGEEKEKNVVPVPKVIEEKTIGVIKKKHKRRKAINRTGFPTKKKKKKIVLKIEDAQLPIETQENNAYDRVPRLGEELSNFVKRTSLEKDLKPEVLEDALESNDSKWDCSFSECNSLPMDECHFPSEIEANKLNKFDLKERMTLRGRDTSPATSIETKASERATRKEIKHRDSSTGSVRTSSDISELDKRIKRKREASLDKIDKKHKRSEDFSISLRKRLRDVSPASSIEPLLSDKRSRNDDTSSDDTKKNKKIPRWRKKFLVAGLFSDYFKEDDESLRQKRRDSSANKNKFIYLPEEHPYGLLPPPYHCGKYVRCRKINFQLPHDLWWQHSHGQLPGRDIVPSWNYRRIKTNVYCIKANAMGNFEPQACNCKGECDDDCINRLVYSECPSGAHRCKNQKIQRHDWAPGLEKFMTDSKGWGVRTHQKIKKGEFILEYVGEVVTDKEFKHRMQTIYTNDTHHYCLHLDGGLVIDGHRMGGDGRFVNHSCQPNCEMQKWSVNGHFRMALFSLRDIQPREELTYDYNFSLFNPSVGQVCKCESENCRGVIGGKSQRVKQYNNQEKCSEANNNNKDSQQQPTRVGRPRKNQARRTTGPKEVPTPQPPPMLQIPLVKPLSHQQKIFALEHHCFLLRNLSKVKRIRERSLVPVMKSQLPSNMEDSSVFLSQLNALRQPRNMRTRRLAQAEENPELNKAAKLAEILKDLYNVVINARDEKNELLATSFMTLPSKRKLPEYFQKIVEPIDLATIELSISSGVYRSVESFDQDMNKLFANSVKFFGRTSDLGIAATRLRKVYGQAKVENADRFEEAIGEKPSSNFLGNGNPGGEDEDVIRCICGLFRDEGLMIQCERCLVWQHCECVKADPSAASYHCERCVPRKVDFEIPLEEFTEHGHRYYVSLMRGNLQLRQGDTVYVLRDIPIVGTDKKHTYETIGKIEYSEMDIFRIERLWKDSKTGERFAFGHHYLRPHETFHEPSRRFFPNEVMRVPLYEVVPVELIMSQCWVMDLNTYCKGRPLGAIEEHVYICEYRVDKGARLFSKVSKPKFPICTKTYSFEKFDQKVKISRTYCPHELEQPLPIKPRGRKPCENENETEQKKIKEHLKQQLKEHHVQHLQEVQPIVRSREEQRSHLNGILLKLLSRLPTKQVLDVSYLLEGGRRRKKQSS